jgi:DnaJ-domain-containing protein 1
MDHFPYLLNPQSETILYGEGGSMKNIDQLSNEERIFFAGCIKNMMLADGSVDEAESKYLETVIQEFGFSDYEERLSDFENDIKDTDSFWEMADRIEGQETRDLIIETLYMFSIQDGIEEMAEKKLLEDLKDSWSD